MIGAFVTAIIQFALLLAIAPLVTGVIRTMKARLQVRRGPGILQPYLELHKLFRKGMVIPDTASWIFDATPYVVFATAAIAGLMVPMVAAEAPLGLFGGVLAVVYLLGLGPLLSGAGRTRYRQFVRRTRQQPRDDHRGARRAGHDAGGLHRGDRRQFHQPHRSGPDLRRAPPGIFWLRPRCWPAPRCSWC